MGMPSSLEESCGFTGLHLLTSPISHRNESLNFPVAAKLQEPKNVQRLGIGELCT